MFLDLPGQTPLCFLIKSLLNMNGNWSEGPKKQKRVGVAACENLEKVDQCGGLSIYIYTYIFI